MGCGHTGSVSVQNLLGDVGLLQWKPKILDERSFQLDIAMNEG